MASHADFVAALWSTTLPALFGLCLYGLWVSFRLLGDDRKTLSFVFCSGKANTPSLAAAFVAASLGSWIFTQPGHFAASSGVIGLIIYSFSIGLAILLVVSCSKRMTRDDQPSTVAAFTRRRFNALAEAFFTALITLNMCVLMLNEYSSIVAIFYRFVDTAIAPAVLAVGLLSLAFNVTGGFLPTLLVARHQCAAAAACVALASLYLAINWRLKLLSGLSKNDWGTTTDTGLRAVAVFPFAVIPTLVFNEAIWQRCWAAHSPAVLTRSGRISAAAATLLPLALGLISLLAQASSAPPYLPPVPPAIPSPTHAIHPYHTTFQALRPSPAPTAPTRLASWGGVAAVLAAALLSHASLASLQSGLSATFATYFLTASPLFVTRLFTVVANTPLILIALLRPNLTPLFYLNHALCAVALLPFLLALPPALRTLYSGDMPFYCIIATFLIATCYGIQRAWDSSSLLASIGGGLQHVWWRDTYDYQPLLAILIASLVSVTLIILLNAMLCFMLHETRVPGCFCLGDQVATIQKNVGSVWDLNGEVAARRVSATDPQKGFKVANTDAEMTSLARVISHLSLRGSFSRASGSLTRGHQAVMEIIRQRSWATAAAAGRVPGSNGSGTSRGAGGAGTSGLLLGRQRSDSSASAIGAVPRVPTRPSASMASSSPRAPSPVAGSVQSASATSVMSVASGSATGGRGRRGGEGGRGLQDGQLQVVTLGSSSHYVEDAQATTSTS